MHVMIIRIIIMPAARPITSQKYHGMPRGFQFIGVIGAAVMFEYGAYLFGDNVMEFSAKLNSVLKLLKKVLPSTY